MKDNEINPFEWNMQPAPNGQAGNEQWPPIPQPQAMPYLPPPFPMPPAPQGLPEPFPQQPMPSQSAPYPAEYEEPVVRESILSPSTAAAFSPAPAPDAPYPPAPAMPTPPAYPAEQYAPEPYIPEPAYQPPLGYQPEPEYQPVPEQYGAPVQNPMPYVPAWQQPAPAWQPIEPSDNAWNPQSDTPAWQPIEPSEPVQPFPGQYAYPPMQSTPPAMPDSVPSPYTAAQMPEPPAPPAQDSIWTPPDLLPSSEPSFISEEEQMSLDDETVVDEEALGHVAILRMDDGEEISIVGPTVLGRVPIAPAEYAHASVHVLHDESKRMSKTHALISFDDEGVYVRDLGSRNGVRFEIDGSKNRIPENEDVRLPEGACVHLGGRSFTVLQPEKSE